MILQGEKVVTALEMARVEGRAIQRGSDERLFMQHAGTGIAAGVEQYVIDHGLPRVVTLLVGKGNNGGDAYVAGSELLKRGFRVEAHHIFPLESCSPLCRAECAAFQSAGGKVHFTDPLPAFPRGVILDGLVGTGFQGKAEGPLADAIVSANASHLPILAIDIPSGVNGNTGEVASIAIRAAMTFYLEFPKLGFFLNQGWNCVGRLKKVSFQLPREACDEAVAEAFLLNDKAVLDLMPSIDRHRHKYEAGYLLAVAGSRGMGGAAFLACLAALRIGTGICRLFYRRGLHDELGHAPLELVKERVSVRRFMKEGKRARAALIGPGMGRDFLGHYLFHRIFHATCKLDLPTLFDADALYFLSHHPRWKLPTTSVLTPHRGELEKLLRSKCKRDEELFKQAANFAEERGATLIWKGAPSFLFHPRMPPLISLHGDPGMATAGTGDVLSGMIAGLLAQGLKGYEAAVLGLLLHGLAGEHAAARRSSYSLIAEDIIEELSPLLRALQHAKN